MSLETSRAGKARAFRWCRGIAGAGFLLLALSHCSEVPGDQTPVSEATASPVNSRAAPSGNPVRSLGPSGFPSNETFVRVAKEAMASVVNISSKRRIEQQGGSSFFDDPLFRRFFGEEFDRRFQQPRERQAKGLGSGVIVRSDGYIVTNHHVVERAEELLVLLGDKRRFRAELIGTDSKTDLAIIKVEAEDLPTLPWGDSSTLQVGEMVLAVGNPFGLNQTVTMGIVSAVGRANVGIVDYENFIQTDAAINPGNSGGALVNLSGELIGINTAIFSRTGGSMGIGFAIPSGMVKTVMQGLMTHGKVIRGWLGVSIQELTPELAAQFEFPETAGALVGDVFEGSPAGDAGIQRGDIISKYQGTVVKDPAHLRTLVAETEPDTRVTVDVWRDGQGRRLAVSIGEMPKDVASLRGKLQGKSEGKHALTGITVEPNATGEATGVTVTGIAPHSPAERAGLRRGDILLEVNRKPIGTMRDFERVAAALTPRSTVLVLVQRGRGTVFLSISP